MLAESMADVDGLLHVCWVNKCPHATPFREHPVVGVGKGSQGLGTEETQGTTRGGLLQLDGHQEGGGGVLVVSQPLQDNPQVVPGLVVENMAAHGVGQMILRQLQAVKPCVQ